MPVCRNNNLEYVLGVDIGTGAIKCCVAGTNGEPVCVKSLEYMPVAKADGTVEQDPDEWYEALKNVLGQVRSSLDTARIGAVCVTGQMRGLTLIGADQKPLANAILWNDTRCVKEAEALREHHAEFLQRITYNPINTMCTLPKILWLKHRNPELWERTDRFIYPKDYVNFRLTDIIATDHSDASGSSVYDFHQGCWSAPVMDRFQLEPEKFPKITKSFDVCGMVTAKASAETGLRQGTPVFMGGSDSTVELYAIGVLDDTQCKIRLGSSCGISTVVQNDQWHAGMDHYCWKPVASRDIVLDINTRFCAQSVKWLRDVFYSEYPKTPETYDLIDREAEAVPPGADGLIYHPYLQGEDAPYWDTQLRGMFHGISSAHGRRHFARAVLEGVAFSIKDVLDTYPDIYRNCNVYLAIGGGAKSGVWRQMIADVLGKDIRVPKYADAAYGACLIALKGLGGADLPRQTASIVSANLRQTEQYQRNYRNYKMIVTDQR